MQPHPYYMRHPDRCTALTSMSAAGKRKLEREDIATLNIREMACVVIYTVRSAKRQRDRRKDIKEQVERIMLGKKRMLQREHYNRREL